MPRCCCVGFCPSDAAVPVERLWVISNIFQRFPAPPFLLKPSFCLQHGFICCGDHLPCSCVMPGRAKRGILNPEGRGTPQPRPGMVVGNQDLSCAVWPQTRPSHDPVFPLFSLQLLGNCIPANSCPRLTFHSPCLWQGLLAFAMPSVSTAHPSLLSLESRAIPLLLPGLLSSAL